MSEVKSPASPATVKTRVTMGFQVLRAADGSVEDYPNQYAQTVEMDYDMAVSLIGKEKADELFKGVERSTDGD